VSPAFYSLLENQGFICFNLKLILNPKHLENTVNIHDHQKPQKTSHETKINFKPK